MRQRITWGKGLNADVLPSELVDGFCSFAQNVRFRNGFAERVSGDFDAGPLTGGAALFVGASTFQSAAVASFVFSYSASSRLLYRHACNSGNTVVAGTDVSPASVPGTPIESLTAVGTAATLTVAAPGDNGVAVGDSITISGATPAAYNGTFTVTAESGRVINFTLGAAPGAAASPVGSYVINSKGPDTFGFRPTSGVFNGLYLLNYPQFGLFYYFPGTTARFTLVPGSLQSRYVRPFRNYIFQLGVWSGATFYPYRVSWSSAAEPGTLPSSFTASATNDSGDVELTGSPGVLIDALPLGDDLIIYKSDAAWAARLTGGNEVFSFTRLPGEDGLWGNGCVVDTPVGHVFISSSGEIMVHQGGPARSISAGRVKVRTSAFRADKALILHNQDKSEVWVMCGAEILIWNYIEDTWGQRALPPDVTVSSALGSGRLNQKDTPTLLSAGGANLYHLDAPDGSEGYQALPSIVTRLGLDFGDPDVVKNLQRSRWNFDGLGGATYSIEHGSSMTADATPTISTAATYTLGTTDYVDSRATGGKYLAVRCTWSNTTMAEPGKVRSTDLDVTLGGRR